MLNVDGREEALDSVNDGYDLTGYHFLEETRRVLGLARKIATFQRGVNVGVFGSSDILRAILVDGKNMALKSLDKLQIDLAAIVKRLDEFEDIREYENLSQASSRKIVHSPESRAVLNEAMKRSRNHHGDDCVGTEHLLEGILMIPSAALSALLGELRTTHSYISSRASAQEAIRQSCHNYRGFGMRCSGP